MALIQLSLCARNFPGERLLKEVWKFTAVRWDNKPKLQGPSSCRSAAEADLLGHIPPRWSHNALILVGPLPPPAYGQSLSFKMLVDGMKERGIALGVINISSKYTMPGDTLSFRRAFEYMGIIFRYLAKTVLGHKIVYITIAQSRRGFIRDLAMISFAALKRHRIVLHLKGGNYRSFYDAQPRWLRWMVRLALRKADAILVLSKNLRPMFYFDPELVDKIHVVPNGLPIEVHDPRCGKRLPDSADFGQPIRILYLSNLIESKGYFDVLEAVRLLRDKRIRVECHFCGVFMTNNDDVRVRSTRKARQLFESYVKMNELGNEVRYTGPVSGKDKLRELREAHFFILPTYYNNEGQPVSIIEAMAYGNVVIATDYRAIPEMVVHEHTGILVPFRNPEAIASAMARIIAEPDRYQQMSQQAIERFYQCFTQAAHLTRILPFLVTRESPAACDSPI